MVVIRELGRGKYSDCFKVTDDKGHAVAMKLSYYQEATIRAFARHSTHGNMEAAHVAKDQDAVSVSMAMAEVAKQMRAHGVSPHFVRVYCEADIRFLPLRLKALVRDRLTALSPSQVKYSHVCLMQLYTGNLTSFLAGRINDDAIRAILFQVVYTLACLQKVFPGFRHNDLSSNNVLVKSRPRPGCSRYNVQGHIFYVCAPVHAALADFDFTHVPGHDVLSNERVLSGKYKIGPELNDSYDTHLLLRSVLSCLSRRSRPAATDVPETWAFLQSLRLPRTSRVGSTAAHMTPSRLMCHPYFACLKTPQRHDREFTLP